MRVFVAGASGALGSRLVPQLIDAGHEVIGTHNSPASAQLLQELGAEPVRLDLLDARRAQGGARQQAGRDRASGNGAGGHQVQPEPGQDLRHHQPVANRGNRCAAGRVPAGGRAPARSAEFRAYLYARQGGPIKTEADPVDETPPPNTGQTFAAITYLEKATTDFGGIARR